MEHLMALIALSLALVGNVRAQEPALPPGNPALPGIPNYTVPAAFPTAAFKDYYKLPTHAQQPQPAIYDPVLHITFPPNLTDPENIPSVDPDPVVYPNSSDARAAKVVGSAVALIQSIASGGGSNCTKCKSILDMAKNADWIKPSAFPAAMVAACKVFKYASNSSCEEMFDASTFGAVWTQVLFLADVTGMDGDYICSYLNSNWCPPPYALPSKVIFPKPKPANAVAPASNGDRVKVLHLSDFHLDPRYWVEAEANCSTGLCCRRNNENSASPGVPLLPAPLHGAFK